VVDGFSTASGLDLMTHPNGPQWDWSLIRERCAAEALRMLRRHQDAEEVAQEALARAWRSRRSCHTPEAPLPWCLQITRNEALRLISRRRGRAVESLKPDGEIEDHKANGEHQRALVRVDLDRALRQLTQQERQLIALRYTDDCSHPEIAARLLIPEATARVRLHRAHKHLRALLEGPTQAAAVPDR
jgi:RNA polymerase sigma-70 factor (ECF subfamily)